MSKKEAQHTGLHFCGGWREAIGGSLISSASDLSFSPPFLSVMAKLLV
jgi:hypothetical protein